LSDWRVGLEALCCEVFVYIQFEVLMQ
jgi:hypothetical protein